MLSSILLRVPWAWRLNRHVPASLKTFLRPILGAQDPPEIQAALRASFDKRDEVAIDVGANGGYIAEILLAHFGRVYAFEPLLNSRLADLARNNRRLVVTWVAVGSKPGDLIVAYRRGEYTSVTQEFAGWGTPQEIRAIPCTSLDYVFAAASVCDFVKIDVEGFEVDACLGMARLINRCKPMLFIEIHSRDNGPFIEGLFPFLKWTTYRHPSYVRGSDKWKDHYWICGR